MAFLVLTDAQGARLRNRVGDVDTADPKLSDTVLDAIYTDANSNLDVATVYALQELVGIYSMHVNVGGLTEINEQRGDRVKRLEERLAYWEKQAGLSGGSLTAGTLDYNIDTDYDDLNLA